eukprot:3892514-Pyramimonas_sp.AAC.1
MSCTWAQLGIACCCDSSAGHLERRPASERRARHRGARTSISIPRGAPELSTTLSTNEAGAAEDTLPPSSACENIAAPPPPTPPPAPPSPPP